MNARWEAVKWEDSTVVRWHVAIARCRYVGRAWKVKYKAGPCALRGGGGNSGDLLEKSHCPSQQG